MPIDLKKPLSWLNATHEEQQMLQALQGNILKGHGRPETTNIFFAFKDGKPHAWRRALREIAVFHVTSAHQQLLETATFQKCGKSGETFVASFLSHKGYEAIERSAAAPTGEPLFEKGMHHSDSVDAVGDTPTDTWEPKFTSRIDGMILVGDMVRNRVRLKRDEIVKILLGSGAKIVYEQVGSALKDKSDNGIEHFGYVDGRSQPLLLVEDVEKESRDAGVSRWDPKFPLNAALVNETPADKKSVSYGSYFVFRKLEQNVLGFKHREQELAKALDLVGNDKRERAGAQVVGRFEDGTPITLSDEAKKENPRNDFNYNDDAGTRCPFQAHIRKVNPRGSNPGGGAQERERIMPRRGIPYEDVMRSVHPSDLPESDSLEEFNEKVAGLLPRGGVGLLFMAYNRSLKEQFEVTQRHWANAPSFPKGGSGVDPVIGLGATPGAGPLWRKTWDDPSGATQPFDFNGFVTLRGGEYFFAPSLNFFKSL